MPFTRNFQFELTETDLMININSAQKVLENFKKEISVQDEPSQLLKMIPLLTIFTDYLKV